MDGWVCGWTDVEMGMVWQGMSCHGFKVNHTMPVKVGNHQALILSATASVLIHSTVCTTVGKYEVQADEDMHMCMHECVGVLCRRDGSRARLVHAGSI